MQATPGNMMLVVKAVIMMTMTLRMKKNILIIEWTGEVKRKSPTYAYKEEEMNEDDRHQYKSYPVERNTRTTCQARDSAMKVPVKTKFDAIHLNARLGHQDQLQK